jgi:hypothetical protein
MVFWIASVVGLATLISSVLRPRAIPVAIDPERTSVDLNQRERYNPFAHSVVASGRTEKEAAARSNLVRKSQPERLVATR